MTPLYLAHALGRTSIEFSSQFGEVTTRLARQIPDGARVAVVSDPVVGPLWADRLEAGLRDQGFEVWSVRLVGGEEHKSLATVVAAMDDLLDRGIRRDDHLVAVGGGVVGDEAGLLASLLLRGIPFHQVPTTLLAMVDASIGGKVGVDHRSGKNRIGAFHHPVSVQICPVLLETLPGRELAAGMAEVVKSALIRGDQEVSRVESHVSGPSSSSLLAVIRDSIATKVEVVEQDEREGGWRRVLNLGHTLGHALESATDYRRFRHGEAVAWGLEAVIGLSQSRGLLSASEAERLIGLVHRACPGRPKVEDLGFSRLQPWLGADKKSGRRGLTWVLLEGVGRPVLVDDVAAREIEAAWEACRIG